MKGLTAKDTVVRWNGTRKTFDPISERGRDVRTALAVADVALGGIDLGLRFVRDLFHV